MSTVQNKEENHLIRRDKFCLPVALYKYQRRQARARPALCWVSWVGLFCTRVLASKSSEVPELVSLVSVPQLALYQLKIGLQS